jgi:hypothetical protein
MPEPKEHYRHRNIIETILRHVPGFRGYLEKEYRRESDELQRTWLADRLQRSKRVIDELARSLADTGQIDILPQIDRLRTKLDKLIWRIRSAMQGYSGFFDLVRIREPELDHVYEHDAALLEQVDGLGQAIEGLPGDPDRLSAALAQVHERIDTLERAWDVREDILKGLD